MTKTNYITVTAGATQMYVDDITVTRTTQGPWVRGQATVTIFGDNGSPVSNATVTGDFTGPTPGTFSGATNSSGQVTFTSDRIKNPSGQWCFEVTNVTHATLSYNSSSNNVTQACESGVVFSESPTAITNTSERSTTTLVYPNPFNAGTNITFRLSDGGQVDVTVYNVLGQAVRHLASDYYSAGDHTVYFDGNDDRGQVLGTGMYFYRVTSPSATITRQMLLLK